MKKRIAYLLAAALVFSSVLPAYAADEKPPLVTENESGQDAGIEEETDGGADQKNTIKTSDEAKKQESEALVSDEEGKEPGHEDVQAISVSENEKEEKEVAKPVLEKNRVYIRMTTVRDLYLAEEFQAVLADEEGKKYEGTIILVEGKVDEGTSEGPRSAEAYFEVDPGNYTLTVSNPKYQTYSQKLEVEEDYDYTIDILNGKMIYSHEGKESHQGIIRLGDVNQDGHLNDQDADLIIQAIEDAAEGKGSPEDADYIYDLNDDGVVDMVDLQMLAQSIAEEREDYGAVPEKSISAKVLSVDVDIDKVKVTGDIQSILSDGAEGVKLESADAAQEISEQNPIEITIPVVGDKAVEMGGLVLAVNEANPITSGAIEVETEDGEKIEVPLPVLFARRAAFRRSATATPTARWENGTLVVDFKGQVAVKKVTIVITGVQNNNLAEISRVEFLNDMENRIPPPVLDIPQNVKTEVGNKRFVVSWDACNNITGYEIEISDGKTTETRHTVATSMEIMAFGHKELVNETTYTVRVQSVNGGWKSGYGDRIEARPFTTSKPPAPDNLNVVGEYRSIMASWKDMEDTDTYNLYYKKETDTEFTKIADIKAHSYEITGLEDSVTYEIYVTGVNRNGEGPKSLCSKATTINIMPVALPQYRLLNTSTGEGSLSAHIKSATISGSDVRSMIDSPLDGENKTSALGVFDNAYTSYYNIADWDDGCEYYAGNKGITVELDQESHVGYITLAQAIEKNNLSGAKVYADGKLVQGASVGRRTDAKGRAYYLIKFPSGGVKATRFQVCIKSYGRGLSIAEMRLHEYDSLEDDVLGLFSDDLHTTLRDDVKEGDFEELQKRLDTKQNEEFHLDQDTIQKELDNARTIFEQKNLEKAVTIHTNITAKKDGGKGFGGLNAWQPLGVSAYANENIVIYVGSNKGIPGNNTDLSLYATQYHSESGAFFKEVCRLKVGRNEVTIPGISNRDFEKGGSLYVAYVGNNQNDQYAVRVSGGVQIPTLDLYQVTDENERRVRIQAYVEELEETTAKLEAIHEEFHGKEAGPAVAYAYDEKNCISGATEIMLDQMMYSVSSKQILKGLGEGSLQAKADKLDESLKAMDQMMTLYYQHKGLNDQAAAQVDRLPSQHLNIRYHRMFAGAFMYASGNHIGIEWPEVAGLAGGKELVSENGRYISGQLFGWGIGHEIGHNINQGAYAVAEITNNYFAQLSTRGNETNDTARFQYPDVYKQVTSGSTGRPTDQRIALAMYWQLHLGYDRGYNYKIYEDYEEQLQNLFYARVDTYARTPSKAPTGNGEKALRLSGNIDQDFIRLASAAAERDLTDFFLHWGLVPNQETTDYISQFEAETRAIYYVNDESRVYEIEHGTGSTIKGQDVLTEMEAVVDSKVKNDVTIQLGHTADPDVVLGYEITRCITSGGKVEKQVIGFTTESEFTDHVASINNRVVTYEVAAVDHFMNRSAVKSLAPVKIEHEGDHDKSFWNVELTNIVPGKNESVDNTEEYPDEVITEDGRESMIDNDVKTVFRGTAEQSKEASIVLDFGRTLTVTGIRYRAGETDSIGDYTVLISQDKENWKEVASGNFESSQQGEAVYFQNGKDSWVYTQEAAFLKLVIKGTKAQEFTVAELDVLGPTGDNVDFRAEEDGKPIIGILKSDYTYDEKAGYKIPSGSLVFIGKYKGNPAYNTGLLYDENGNIVGGVSEEGYLIAEQIILADVPEEGELGETYDGTWIYWITPENLNMDQLPKKVRAELYRTDDAQANTGQRLVSDSMFYDMPGVLPEIEFMGQ
ncbi:fibronectin type III domain-containing protein [Roseburia hominis]